MGRRLLALLVLASLTTVAMAATDVLPLAAGSQTSRADVSIEHRDDNGYRLQLRVTGLERERVELGGRSFDRLSLPGGGVLGTEGQAGLPTITRLVSVPRGMTVTARVAGRQMKALPPLTPAPVLPIAEEKATAPALDLGAYRSTPSCDVGVTVGEVASMHGLRVVPVTFAPVAYDAVSGELSAAASLDVELSFISGGAATGDRPSSLVPESFATLYEQSVIGWTRGDDVHVGPGRIIYVCPDNSSVVNIVGELAQWRREQGYAVDVVTTGETGVTNTAIRNWLMSQYAASDPPLEFVVLVGDANGTVAVPTFTESTSGLAGEGDHDYARLDGNDVLPDVHVGRISVRTTTELQTAVSKILDYEREPDMSDTDWFTTAGLTGDPTTSGYSCIFTNQFIKQELLRLGYTQVDTIWSGSFTTLMMATINQGETLFTYRGLGGMSGMTANHIAYTTNGRKLPFAVILTCDTGSFMDDTTARSEAWLRAANGGGIGAIGTATIGTHTRYNNCMFLGIAEQLLCSGDFRLGPALSAGKLNFYTNYWTTEQSKVWTWMTWNNLMGDPATDMWTGVPAALDVDYPTVVATTANAMPVTVTAGGMPVAGARVAVVQGDGLRSVGYTDQTGRVLLSLDGATAGDMSITVIGHDLYPHRGFATMGAVDRSLDLAGMTVADGGGNGDGVANPGEGLRLSLQLQNGGSTVAPDATAQLVSGPAWAGFDTAPVSFGSIAGGGSAWGGLPWDLSLADDAPGGASAVFELVATSGEETWSSQVVVPVSGARGSIRQITWDVLGGALNPGDSSGGTLLLENMGDLSTGGVTGTLRSSSRWVDVTDEHGSWGAIAAGGLAAQSDPFAVVVDASCYPGHLAGFILELEFAEGGTQTLEFTANVGTASAGDPTGPDAYGYHAFSNDDSDPLAPTYAWADAAANGQATGLSDQARWDDDVMTMDLPFPFVYYGQSYDELSICTNGWLSFGRTDLKHYRNWTMPADGSADAMIAAFWDDLAQGTVYTWHDAANHRFVVQWDGFGTYYSAGDGYFSGNCTFQIILTDPAYSDTQTGDGLITMQYQAVTVSVDETNRFTTGIQNHDRSDGLTYAYANQYAGGAASVTPGRAIRFVPIVSTAQGAMEGEITNLSGGGQPIAGAQVSLVNGHRTFTSSVDGRFGGSAPVGTWDVAVSHPSCPPDTVRGVVVTQGQTATVDFELADIAGPCFTLTTVLESTPDTAGPYVVETLMDDITGVASAQLAYTSSSSGGPFTLPLVLVDGATGRYRAEIPGQPLGTTVQYWLTANDVLELEGADPVGAPWPCYSFQVAATAVLTDEDFESGTNGWQVNAAGSDDAQAGAWELENPIGTEYNGNPVAPEDDHTPTPGVRCWFTGQHVAGQGAGYADVDGGATTLWSPVWNAAGYSQVTLSYWRWFTNDTGSNPGEDPWLVQISNDGGSSWSVVENTTSSAASWQEVTVDVTQIFADPDQLRLRFTASDGGNGGSLVEAALDDLRLSAVSVTPDAAAPTVSLLAPNGGETYVTGQTLPISWTADDDVGVVEARVYLSLDDGLSWGEPVAQGALNGSAQWTVDVPYTTELARVRVDVLDGQGRLSSDISAGVFTLTADITDAPAPSSLSLAQNQPNPFNPQTVIAFELPSTQRVTLAVYDVQGRRVRSLISGELKAGRHTATWRGLDDAGQRMASGTYFYRLESGEGSLVRKMLLVK